MSQNPRYLWQHILGLVAKFHYFGTKSSAGEIVVGG
jgi:hypothetical protein